MSNNQRPNYGARPRTGMGGGPRRGGPMGMGNIEKANDFAGTMKKLIRYIGKYKLTFLIVLIIAVISTLLSVVSPRIMGNVTNQLAEDYVMIRTYDAVDRALPQGESPAAGSKGADYIDHLDQAALNQLTDEQLRLFSDLDISTRPVIHLDIIGKTLLMLVGIYVLSSALRYIQEFVMSGVSAKITYNFRRDISQKISRIPLKYFDSTLHGDVLSRVTNDVDSISMSLHQSITQLLTAIVTLVGVLAMMILISWQMTLMVLAIVPLSLVIIRFIVKRSQKYFKAQQENLGNLNGIIEETYGGHTIVKVFGAQPRMNEDFRYINDALYKSSWLSQFLSGMMMPLMSFVGNLGFVGVCVLGGYLAINGQMQVGDIQAFISYVRQFTQPMTQLATVTNTLQSTAAAAERVFSFLEQPEEVPESENSTILTSPKGEVTFDHIVFGYQPEKVVIKGFNAHINPGQKVAIVGPTGAGKTTIVNLLMRFYDVDKGSILIDGVDIRDMKRSDLRSLFGMVLQDTWLFGGTIKENILYAKPDATEQELSAATRAAQVDHFIQSMPGGFDMELNEEVTNISQGQKQLLTIARAMLANPAMLILDEATSSVDTRTEVLIQRAMDNLMKGRTSFIIAHRLSTIRDADLILVLNEGNIVEQGTHQQLLDAGGFYSELYNSQFTAAAADA